MVAAQRIGRYPLLLRDLRKYTPPAFVEDCSFFDQAYEAFNTICQEVNLGAAMVGRRAAVAMAHIRFDQSECSADEQWLLNDLVQPYRRLLIEFVVCRLKHSNFGRISSVKQSGPMALFCFNDKLILAELHEPDEHSGRVSYVAHIDFVDCQLQLQLGRQDQSTAIIAGTARQGTHAAAAAEKKEEWELRFSTPAQARAFIEAADQAKREADRGPAGAASGGGGGGGGSRGGDSAVGPGLSRQLQHARAERSSEAVAVAVAAMTCKQPQAPSSKLRCKLQAVQAATVDAELAEKQAGAEAAEQMVVQRAAEAETRAAEAAARMATVRAAVGMTAHRAGPRGEKPWRAEWSAEWAFVAVSEGQLTLAKSEVVFKLPREGGSDGWCMVRSAVGLAEGWVPEAYLRRCL